MTVFSNALETNISKIKAESTQGSVDYWRERLSGIPEVQGFPLDNPRPALANYSYQQINQVLPASLKCKLENYARENSLPVFAILHACLSALLHRYSGEERTVLGSTANCLRLNLSKPDSASDSEFVPLRLDFSSRQSMMEKIQQSAHILAAGYRHRLVSFQDLVAELGRTQTENHHPIFQTAFYYWPQGYTCDFAFPLKNLDLAIHIFHQQDDLQMICHYAEEILSKEKIACLAQHLCRTLDEVLANPQQQISEFHYLSEEETIQLLRTWNGSVQDFPRDKCVTELIEEQARKNSEATAVVYCDQQLNYGQLNAQANKLARFLMARGVRADELLALSMQRSANLIVAVLGVLKAGASYVPIDPDYPQARVLDILEDTRSRFVLTDARSRGLFESLDDGVIEFESADIQRELNACSESNLSVDERREQGLDADTRAYVIFTSGSTGRPKGVEIEHRGLVNTALELIDKHQMNSQSRVLQFASISFDAAVAEWCTALVAGACLVIPKQSTVRDMTALEKLVVEQAVTHAILPPAILPELHLEKWSGVHTLVVAGDKCNLELAKTWCKARTLINGYGPSECTVAATTAEISEAETKMHIGKPMANVKVYVLDQYGKLLPTGVPGELFIGGVGVARGYLNRPELTAERFITDPFSLELRARMYKTGDRVRWLPGGNLEFLGRLDNQVKISGYRIEPGEIEARMLQHPELALVAVKKVEHMGESALAAWYTTRAGATLHRAELRSFLKQTLPVYMIPAFFVEMPDMPLNNSGKIDRHQLPHPAVAFRRAV